MPATRCYAGKNDVDGLDIIPTSKAVDYCASNYLPYIASTYSLCNCVPWLSRSSCSNG